MKLTLENLPKLVEDFDERLNKAKQLVPEGLGILPLRKEGQEKVYVAFLRPVNRIVLRAFQGILQKHDDPMQANEVLLKNLIVKEVSDMQVIEDDALFIPAMQYLEGLIPKAEGNFIRC